MAGGISADQKSLLRMVGDKQLEKRLRRMGAKAAKKVMRPAISAGLTPVAAAARKNAKQIKRTGLLAKSIRKKTGRSGAYGKVFVNPKIEAVVNGKKVRPAAYAHLVEFGTSHSAPKPLLRAALGERAKQALGKIKTKTWERLKKL